MIRHKQKGIGDLALLNGMNAIIVNKHSKAEFYKNNISGRLTPICSRLIARSVISLSIEWVTGST